MIRRRKNFLLSQKMTKSTSNFKKMWETTKEIVGLANRKSIDYPKVFTKDYSNIVGYDKIAFIKYLAEVGPFLASSKLDKKKFRVKTKFCDKKMYLTEIKTQEIIKNIDELDTNNATGPDGIASGCVK